VQAPSKICDGTTQQQQQQFHSSRLIIIIVRLDLTMASFHAQSCKAAGGRNPLLDPSVLQHILSYVGLGHCLFVAPVSWSWRDLYAALQSQQLRVYDKSRKSKIVTCVPQMTLFSSVFASPSRVKHAYQNGLSYRTTAYHRAAGKHADIATLAAAHELGMNYTAATMAGAASCNKLAEVQYLHSQGCPWPSGLLESAAQCNNSELLRWCYEQSCPWESASTATYYTAQSSKVELMAWVLQQPDMQLSEMAMHAAAERGHTAMCQYLHAKQCPWDVRRTNAAARCGHVDLVRWLCDNGCPWDADLLCLSAAKGGRIKVLKHLQQQDLLTSPALLQDTLHYAGHHNKLAAAKWLREQGAE
jgi:hypothetical protein